MNIFMLLAFPKTAFDASSVAATGSQCHADADDAAVRLVGCSNLVGLLLIILKFLIIIFLETCDLTSFTKIAVVP